MTEKEVFETLIKRFLSEEEYKITDNSIEIYRNDETIIVEFDKKGKAKTTIERIF